MPIRVLTQFGFGNVDHHGNLQQSPVPLWLDEPFCGSKHPHLEPRGVFYFTDYAIVRVISLDGVGVVSNLQFYKSDAEMMVCMDLSRRPPDETWFAINFMRASVESSQQLGLLTEDYLIMRPWIDRWGREKPILESNFEDQQEALTAFDTERQSLAGSLGISSALLYSTKDGKLLRFYISVSTPLGVIYEWPQSPHPGSLESKSP